MAEVEINITEDFYLKPLNVEDSKDITAIIRSDNSFFAEWIDNKLQYETFECIKEFIVQELKCSEFGNNLFYTLRDKKNLYGIAGFYNTSNINNKSEIVLWLSNTVRTTQYYTDIIGALLHKGFNDTKFNRITIKALSGDYTLLAVLRKFGFVSEGTERAGSKTSFESYSDILYYGLIKKEYDAQLEFFIRAGNLFKRNKKNLE